MPGGEAPEFLGGGFAMGEYGLAIEEAADLAIEFGGIRITVSRPLPHGLGGNGPQSARAGGGGQGSG